MKFAKAFGWTVASLTVLACSGSELDQITRIMLFDATPSTILVSQGSSSPSLISISVRAHSGSTVHLTVSGLPTGVSGSFSKDTLTANESTTTLLLTASGSAPLATEVPFDVNATEIGYSGTYTIHPKVTVTN